MFPLFQKYLNPQVRTNKLANSVACHFCPSVTPSGILPYFFKLLRVLSRSRMLVKFSLTCIFHHVWKKIQFMVFILENELNLFIFTHVPVPHSKLQVQFLENLFPPRAKNKGAEEAMICFIIIQSDQKIWRWYGTVVYLLYVAWFIIFVNVMALLFCE